MAWKPKYRLHRVKCRRCQQMFEALKPTQAHCSRTCAMQGNPQSLAGGLARRTRTRTAAIARLRALGASDAVIADALRYARHQYCAGHKCGTRDGAYQLGYRKGWAEALNEVRDPRGRKETAA